MDLPAQATEVEVADFSIADLNTRDGHQRSERQPPLRKSCFNHDDTEARTAGHQK
jgi:hypothetical protein